jgi:catechol 2,3-dioxygenase-like lactoylglutathione lyase family enzyme
MSASELDHVIIHIDDWDASHAFYVDVLGLDRVENPEGQANPLGAWAYRLGARRSMSTVRGPGSRAPAVHRRSTRSAVRISPSERSSRQAGAWNC